VLELLSELLLRVSHNSSPSLRPCPSLALQQHINWQDQVASTSTVAKDMSYDRAHQYSNSSGLIAPSLSYPKDVARERVIMSRQAGTGNSPDNEGFRIRPLAETSDAIPSVKVLCDYKAIRIILVTSSSQSRLMRSSHRLDGYVSASSTSSSSPSPHISLHNS
jgi:hypothetical protein